MSYSNYGSSPSPTKTRSKGKVMPVGSPVKTRSRTKAIAVALPVQSSTKSRSSSKAPASASASASKSRSSSKAPASPVKSPRKSKTSAAPLSKQRVSRKRVYKALSKSKAQKAFNEYYANRDYSSETRRNAAIKRDLNSSPRNASKYLVKDERYLLNPGRYDFKGVDAGPNVSKYSGNLAALKLAHKAPRSGRRSHSQVLKEIKRSK
jgi:hypothetical protein